MGYKIGSFNMYKFRAYQSDNEIRKDLSLIGRIIRDSQFDIVALQEVHNKKAMERLLPYIGINWAGCWDSPVTATSNAAEGYAFIWNAMRFSLAAEPRIFYQYKLDRNIWQEGLVRDPYYARFVPVNGPFCELRLINAHIMFSRSGNANEDNPLGNAAMRLNEYDVLARALYPKIADKRYGNNLPGYTFLMGDFNLNLPGSSAGSPYLWASYEILDANSHKRMVTDQYELTTLKMADSDDAKKSNSDDAKKSNSDDAKKPNSDDAKKSKNNSYWANNYDHFTYDGERFEGIGIECSRIDSVQYCKDYIEHRKIVSDHVPIIMDLDFRNGK